MKTIKNQTMENLVDNIWTCGCGALNAAYIQTCGNCNKNT